MTKYNNDKNEKKNVCIVIRNMGISHYNGL